MFTTTTCARCIDSEGDFVVLNKNGTFSIHDKNGLELESYDIVMARIRADNGWSD